MYELQKGRNCQNCHKMQKGRNVVLLYFISYCVKGGMNTPHYLNPCSFMLERRKNRVTPESHLLLPFELSLLLNIILYTLVQVKPQLNDQTHCLFQLLLTQIWVLYRLGNVVLNFTRVSMNTESVVRTLP